jgi:hypothetical protein
MRTLRIGSTLLLCAGMGLALNAAAAEDNSREVIGTGRASVPSHQVRSLGDGIYYLDFQSKAIPGPFWRNPNQTITPYLKEHHLIPPECHHGVAIIEADKVALSPSAFARFRCAQE